jgi:hypothetical protein
MKTRLLILAILLGCYVHTYSGCATVGVAPTGEALCTEQCRKDYPAPNGYEIFGVAGQIAGTEMACKCYKRKLPDTQEPSLRY